MNDTELYTAFLDWHESVYPARPIRLTGKDGKKVDPLPHRLEPTRRAMLEGFVAGYRLAVPFEVVPDDPLPGRVIEAKEGNEGRG